MNQENTKIVKRRRLSLKKILILLLFLYLLGSFVYYLFTLPIKNIYIEGTSVLNDTIIIESAGIKNYPSILRTKKSTLIKKIKSLELVKDVRINKNIFGKLTIIIEENNVLFYNKSRESFVLEDKSEIKSDEYYGIPMLINYVPDVFYEKLIEGFVKLSPDIIMLISEIEYAPLKAADIIIDDSRFLLRMNDGNHVYVNTINILKFNNYPKIYSTLNERKGILNLDSSTENNVLFEPFLEIIEEDVKDEL